MPSTVGLHRRVARRAAEMIVLLLLHQGGWDEMILLAVALVVGVGIVMFTGKKKPTDGEQVGTVDAPPPTDEQAPPPESR